MFESSHFEAVCNTCRLSETPPAPYIAGADTEFRPYTLTYLHRCSKIHLVPNICFLYVCEFHLKYLQLCQIFPTIFCGTNIFALHCVNLDGWLWSSSLVTHLRLRFCQAWCELSLGCSLNSWIFEKKYIQIQIRVSMSMVIRGFPNVSS